MTRVFGGRVARPPEQIRAVCMGIIIRLLRTAYPQYAEKVRTNDLYACTERKSTLDGFEAILVDLEGFDLRLQSRGRHPQLGGCSRGSRHSASAFRQGCLNQGSLLRPNRGGQRLVCRRRRPRLPREPARIDREGLRLTH